MEGYVLSILYKYERKNQFEIVDVEACSWKNVSCERKKGKGKAMPGLSKPAV